MLVPVVVGLAVFVCMGLRQGVYPPQPWPPRPGRRLDWPHPCVCVRISARVCSAGVGQ